MVLPSSLPTCYSLFLSAFHPNESHGTKQAAQLSTSANLHIGRTKSQVKRNKHEDDMDLMQSDVNKMCGWNPAFIYIRREITLDFSGGQDFTQCSENNDPYTKGIKGT